MWLETKFQPFRLRNDKDMGCQIDLHTVGMICKPLCIEINFCHVCLVPVASIIDGVV